MRTGNRDPDGLVMLSFRVPRALKERLEAMAAASSVSIQELARSGIEMELEVREELLDERRTAFARLAAQENTRRRTKLTERASELHRDPRTP